MTGVNVDQTAHWNNINEMGHWVTEQAHHDRMLARPAVQKALATEKSYG